MAPRSALSLVEVLARRARRTPDALAFTVEGQPITYSELAQSARRRAAELAAAGLAPGRPCGIALSTSLEFLRTLFAAQWLGARPVAFDPTLPPAQIAGRARRLRCGLVAAEGALASHLAAEGLPAFAPGEHEIRVGSLADPRPDPVAFLQWTSGTSGEPRAAVIGQAALRASLRASHRLLALSPADVFTGWVPLHHDLGLVRFVFQPVYSGRPCHLVEPSLARLSDWLATAARVGATITAAPDFVYRIASRAVMPTGLDLSRLRVATSGGEPVRQATIRAFEERFDVPGVVRPGYGLAEATLGVAVLRPGEPLRVGDGGLVGCGRPLPGTRVRIVGEGGRDQAAGDPGEIVVRSATLFDGYLDDEAATREALRDGWLHTGDIGVLDADGHLFVLGRRRALIKRGGALVVPREVEEAVDAVEGVRVSAAVGIVVDAAEDVCVVAEVAPGLGDEARAALARAISAAAVGAVGFAPGRIVLAPPRSIPRTPNGKIRHAELAAAVARGHIGGAGPTR